MILGYEQPVEIPVMSIYDKDMMKMYLGALLKDYEEGLAAEKEFNEKYAGFISPSATDTENYYNLSLGPIQLYLNLNPNAIRSVEGRGRLRQLMNNIPYGQLAQIRQSAEAADLYKKALLQGIASGKLDYDTAVALDGDINNWDTLKNGAWNKVAPTTQKTLNELLAPYIEDLSKRGYEYDQNASEKKGKGWLVKSVSDQKIVDQIGRHSADILRDPMVQLRIKQLGLTPEQYLLSDVYSHMRTELPNQEEENKVYMDLLKLAIDKAQLGIALQQAATARMNAKTNQMATLLSAGYTIDKNGKLVKPQTTNTVLPSTHQDVDNASIQKRNSLLGGGSNGGNSKNWEAAVDKYIAYYKNLSKNPKLSKEASKRLKWAQKAKKAGFAKSVENGFFTVNKYGDLIPTAAWENAYTTVQNNTFVNKPLYREATNRALDYRNSYKTGITDDYDRKVAASRFAGTSTIDKNMTPGDGIQNRQVSLSLSNIVFTPYRAQWLSKVKGFRDVDSNIAKKFDEFVHRNKLTAYFTNSSYSKMQHVSLPRSNGGRSFDIDAPVLITHSDLYEFAKSINRNNDIEGVARDLGLTPKTLQNKGIGETGKNAGKQVWRNADYYEADFTRVELNNNTSSAGDYDYQVDKERYGQANAFKLALDRKAKSANRQ